MRLRNLELKDAPRMLEWMHNEDVVRGLNTDFAQMDIEKCKNFIRGSWCQEENWHLAIVDDNDRYMGTVSLKHINHDVHVAEFAIVVHQEAMGKGYAGFAMNEIIQRGIEEKKLQAIYWCVFPTNPRAVRFYDKHHFRRTDSIPECISDKYEQKVLDQLIWYVYDRG